MKVITLLIFFLLISCNNKSKEFFGKENSDLEEFELKGNVKLVVINKYRGVENMGKLTGKKLIKTTKLEFNEYGFLNSMTIQRPNISKSSTLIPQKEQYKFVYTNSEDHFEEGIKSNPKDNYLILSTYENGHLIEYSKYKGNSLENRQIFRYDEIGYLTEKEIHRSNGEIYELWKFSNDNLGNPIKASKYDRERIYKRIDRKFNGNKEVLYQEFGFRIIGTEVLLEERRKIYDEKGKLKQSQYFSNGELEKSFFYNEHQLLDKVIEYKKEYEYSKKGVEYISSRNLYKYNNSGNWIEKIEYYDGELYYIQERNIEYY